MVRTRVGQESNSIAGVYRRVGDDWIGYVPLRMGWLLLRHGWDGGGDNTYGTAANYLAQPPAAALVKGKRTHAAVSRGSRPRSSA